MGKLAAGQLRSHGGRRPGAGRKRKHLQVVRGAQRKPQQVRKLLGLDRPEFKTKAWDARNPVTLLTVATIVFYLTRYLMDSHKEVAVDWAEVAVAFGKADRQRMYHTAACTLATARNGMKKLKVPSSTCRLQSLRPCCHAYIGTHCSLPEIMFCSRIHPLKPTLLDPFTAATAAWLREVTGEQNRRGYMTAPEWITLIAFGKLRQQSAVTLLLPSHSNYLGFHSLAEPSQMGIFIAAQDSIAWTQQLTQEMSKVGGLNSTKASVCLANLWSQFSDPTIFVKLQRTKDYHGMVQVLQELPGHGPFIAKNIVETVLNAVHLSGIAAGDIGTNLNETIEDYLADPVAVLGPGPLALGRFFLGKGFANSDFEHVRRCVNQLCQDATVCYKGASISPGALTGPQMQALWCKLKGTIDDYCTQTLGQHLRR